MPAVKALRPYQERDKKAVLACLQRGQNPLHVCATGGGKTTVFSSVAEYVVRHAGWDVGVLVHRDELLEQACGALADAGVVYGVIAPGHVVTSHKVHVASIATLVARIRAGCRDTARWLLNLRLAIVDEAHHAVAEQWVIVAQAMAKALLYGATATPYRTDGQGLGDVFNVAVKGPTTNQLVEAGWLAPFAVYAPPTKLVLSGLKKTAGDYNRKELQQVVDTPEFNRLVALWYARMFPGVPAIGFCTGIVHANNLCDMFEQDGWLARAVNGKTDDTDRRNWIRGLDSIWALRQGLDPVDVLMSVDLIGEGTDVPVCGAGLMVRPTESTGLFEQQAGRTARPIWPAGFDPNTATADERKAAMIEAGKPFAGILDMVGNWTRHGLPGSDRPWTLDGGIKGQERMVSPVRRCRTCYRVHAWAESCPACGFRYPVEAKKIGMPPVKAIAHLPGVGMLTAEDVHQLPLKTVLEHCHHPDDVRKVRSIRGYHAEWARRVIEEKFGIPQGRRAAGGKR